MKPCPRVGIDVGWKCQWSCAHCFYLRNPSLHQAVEVPWDEIKAKIDRAREGGLTQVVMVGYGEPALSENAPRILDYAHSLGMVTSMITNGACGTKRYEAFYKQGMDHLHISSHGRGETLTAITEHKAAWKLQAELKDWLAVNGLPFRTNATIQQLNYRELPELAAGEVAWGAKHVVLLGFLPHYEWHSHVHEVAVHPAEIRPYLEEAADIVLASPSLLTIRYHPFCHLRPDLWKYVVNARYVTFDPWEWNYSLQLHDLTALWNDSVRIGESVANRCEGCLMRRHCGGWNRSNVEYLGGESAVLTPIKEVPDEYREVREIDGGLHDLNPANRHSGILRTDM